MLLAALALGACDSQYLTEKSYYEDPPVGPLDGESTRTVLVGASVVSERPDGPYTVFFPDAGQVLGVEGEATLVARAAQNASANGLGNVEFRRADLAALDGTESWLAGPWDRLLLDPARAGAAEVVRHIAVIDPRRIVYVSCHPGTLARDAGTLVNDKGYRLDAAGIIDMFPHTAHVESIAVFTKD